MSLLACKSIAGDRSVELDADDLADLEGRLRGTVTLADHPDYSQLRRIWNGMIDRKPAAVARCLGPADAMACVRFARERGLLFSVRGGGHNVAGLAMCDGGLVIDLSAMRGVRVSPGSGTVRVEAGARLGDLDHETQAFGLAVPVGVVSETGIAGLTLHGGLGWLTRKYGLSCDNLLSVDIITADGTLRHASERENPDLFWAIRGGGGNFGLVTSFAFRAHRVGPTAWRVLTMYPFAQAEAGLRRFREVMPDAPEELGLIAVLWSAPDGPPVAPAHRGQPVFVLVGAYTGPLDRAEEVLRPLHQDLGEPVLDLSGPAPWVEIQTMLDEDYPDGRLYYWKSTYMRDLDDEVIAALLDHAERRPSPLSSIDIWAGGGAWSRIPADATAFGDRSAAYLLGVEANWDDPADSQANIAWARTACEDMQSRFRGGTYLNFPGFAEDGEAMLRTTYGRNFDRLQAIKQTYDPENLFRGNLNIAPKAR